MTVMDKPLDRHAPAEVPYPPSMAVEPPATRYATAEGNVHVAYQVVGDGPVDLVFVPAFVSNVDVWWEFPRAARFLTRLASFSRLILLDKRGTGLSDRVSNLETPEERMDDVRAVMDAAHSERAMIFAASEGVPIAILFAASHPERVGGLVLYGGMARWSPAPDYPWTVTDEMYAQVVELATDQWGTGFSVDLLMPSAAGDPEARAWFARYERASASPGSFAILTLDNTQIDVREVLSAVQAPTLIVHRESDSFVHVGGGRYLAAHIPGARYVEQPGSDHAFFGAGSEVLLDEIEEFVTGSRPAPEPDRVLATVVLADVPLGVEAGTRPREVMESYLARARRELERHRASTADVAADRILGTFDAPGRALACAEALQDAAGASGLLVRAVVHTAECEHLGGTVAGAGVHVANRLKEVAAPGEILATGTVRDLVAGSPYLFQSRGQQAIPGLGASVTVLAVVRPAGAAERPPDAARARFEAAVARAYAVSRNRSLLSPLSARETDVARLVADGMSNRAIAERLFISERTVEGHVGHALDKLGFNSRAQLASWVARQS